jgi:hypothetical protein
VTTVPPRALGERKRCRWERRDEKRSSEEEDGGETVGKVEKKGERKEKGGMRS